MISAADDRVSQPMPAVAAPTMATAPFIREPRAEPDAGAAGRILRNPCLASVSAGSTLAAPSSSPPTEQRDRDARLRRLERHLDGHPDRERLERRVDDVGHHPHAVDV